MERKLTKVGLFLGAEREEYFTNAKTKEKELKVWARVRFEIDSFVNDWELEVYRPDRIAAIRSLEHNSLIKMRLTMKEDDFNANPEKMVYRLFLNSFERSKETAEPKGTLVERDVAISQEDLALIIEDDYKHNRNNVENDCMITRLAIIKSGMEKQAIDEFYARYHKAVAKGESPSSYYR